MEIAKNTVVSLQYILKDGNEKGEIIEIINDTNPLLFLFGTGDFFPDFEENLKGKKADDLFSFTLACEEAYGAKQDSQIEYIPKENFVVDGEIDKDLLKLGNILNMSNQDGETVTAKVIEILEDQVRMDFNHILAGKDLYFEGRILGVRLATPEEIDHGHAHGPGGHQH